MLLFFRYKDGNATDEVYVWLWQALEDFTNEERTLFLRFVSGRSRLPTNISEISQRFQLSKGGRVSILENTRNILEIITRNILKIY